MRDHYAGVSGSRQLLALKRISIATRAGEPQDGYHLFKIPPDSKLETSSDIEFGVALDEYYYSSDDTREPLRVTGWDGGGMIWAGYNGRSENGNHEVTEIHEGFFVGTEEEYKKFGAGNEDKVGPIKGFPINTKRRSLSEQLGLTTGS